MEVDRITEILPPSGLGRVDFREIWRYRELLGTLVWRDLKVRYRQTLLGVVWVVGQPLLMVSVFTLIFQKVAGMSLESGVPYPLFVFAGLVPWQFFANGVQNAGVSILGNTQLVSKVYFPRLIIPAAPIAGALIDLGIVGFAILVIQLGYGWLPGLVALIYVPLALTMLLALTFGIGCWMAALNVNYRDVRVIMPFLLQFGMFATPVLYPTSRLPGSLQQIAALNPMTGILGLFRGGLLGEPVEVWHVVLSVAIAGLSLVTGVMAFTRMERQFADVM
jgi:lipopolysaccharide transport system permease protein